MTDGLVILQISPDQVIYFHHNHETDFHRNHEIYFGRLAERRDVGKRCVCVCVVHDICVRAEKDRGWHGGREAGREGDRSAVPDIACAHVRVFVAPACAALNGIKQQSPGTRPPAPPHLSPFEGCRVGHFCHVCRVAFCLRVRAGPIPAPHT